MKDRLTTAPLPLDRPQCSCGTLNARSAIGTAFGQWNAQSAIGTASWPLERPKGFWNSRRLLERALAQLEQPAGD